MLTTFSFRGGGWWGAWISFLALGPAWERYFSWQATVLFMLRSFPRAIRHVTHTPPTPTPIPIPQHPEPLGNGDQRQTRPKFLELVLFLSPSSTLPHNSRCRSPVVPLKQSCAPLTPLCCVSRSLHPSPSLNYAFKAKPITQESKRSSLIHLTLMSCHFQASFCRYFFISSFVF